MEKKNKIVIGSRESKLAVTQSEMVKEYLESVHPELEVEILTMKTTGDIILDRTLDQVGGKGLFVKELDRALLDHRTDISVHSLKDMPMEVPQDLPLLAFSKREDPRDALVLPLGCEELNKEKPIGCSSQRRILQLQKIFPDCTFKSVRGNVQTRLSKLDQGEYSALVLAAAGLKRLGLENRITRYFEPDEMIPAAGQGILAVQGRRDVDSSLLSAFQDMDAYYAAAAERAFITAVDGGCSFPAAAYAERTGETLFLRALYYEEETGKWTTGKLEGSIHDAKEMGYQLAEILRNKCKMEETEHA